jgi:branched-chain amino acid transport system permease protein
MSVASARGVRVAMAVVVIALLPWILPPFAVFDFVYVAAYATAILGLVVLTGMNGQISLGHGAFLAIGGYVAALAAKDAGLPYWLGIPLAGAASGAVGLLIGLIALRLAGVYLALATFSLGVAMPSLLKHFRSVTGGFNGLALHPMTVPTWLPLDSHRYLYYVSWATAGCLFALTAWLVAGRFGRALRALRDNPIAAVSFGVNPLVYKTLAFGWSAALAGVAGAFYAIPTAYLSPDSFSSALSITLLIGAVLGGIATFWGALAGGIIVEFLPLAAQQINSGAPGVVYGVALIVVMLFLPDGLAGGIARLGSRLRGAGGTELPPLQPQRPAVVATHPTAGD